MNNNRLLFFVSMTLIFFIWMYLGSQREQPELHQKKDLTVEQQVNQETQISKIKLDVKKEKQVEKSSEQLKRIITVTTQTMIVEFNESTGEVYRVVLDSLFKNDTNHYTILDNTNGHHLSLSVENQSLRDLEWTASVQQKHYFLTNNPLTLVFTTTLKNKVEFKRFYTLYPKGYLIQHKFKTNASIDGFASIDWTGGINKTEENSEQGGLGAVSYDEFVYSNGELVSREKLDKPTSFNEEEGSVKWVGIRQKYVVALINFNSQQDYKIRVRPLVSQIKNEFNEITEKASSYEVVLRNKNFVPSSFTFDLLVLPLQYNQIKAYDQGYEKILFLGYEWFLRADLWYVKLAGLVLNLLNWFYSIIPNYGIAIICLTLLIRCLLLPFTIMQTKSMSKLQEHAPMIKKIRQDNKNNPQKAQKEIMAYYKMKNVNPVAGMLGCLPLIFQFPVFIALFHVLSRAVELKGVPFLFWITDLSQPDVVVPSLVIPYIFPTGLTILPFLMAFTMFLQTKLTMTDPNQKMLVWMMPLLMFVFSASFPSGLVLYWTVSNVFTIVQTKLIKKKSKVA